MTSELHLELNALIDAILLKNDLVLDDCCFMLFDTLLNILSMAADQAIVEKVNVIFVANRTRFMIFLPWIFNDG